jgi:hypothetical protein
MKGHPSVRLSLSVEGPSVGALGLDTLTAAFGVFFFFR